MDVWPLLGIANSELVILEREAERSVRVGQARADAICPSPCMCAWNATGTCAAAPVLCDDLGAETRVSVVLCNGARVFVADDHEDITNSDSVTDDATANRV
jgi:hypothetical protein